MVMIQNQAVLKKKELQLNYYLIKYLKSNTIFGILNSFYDICTPNF